MCGRGMRVQRDPGTISTERVDISLAARFLELCEIILFLTFLGHTVMKTMIGCKIQTTCRDAIAVNDLKKSQTRSRTWRLKRLKSSYNFIELPVVKRRADRSVTAGYQVTRITCRLNLAVIIYLGGFHRPSNLETLETDDERRRT